MFLRGADPVLMSRGVQLDREFLSRLMIAMVCLAVFLPVAFVIWIVLRESASEQRRKADMLVGQMLERAYITDDQMKQALAALEADIRRDGPCSPAHQQAMGRLMLTFAKVQGSAFIEDGRFSCSSLGSAGMRFPIGAPAYVNSAGLRVWTFVKFPFAGRGKFLVVGTPSGNAVIVNPDLAQEFALDDPRTAIGLFNLKNRHIISAIGPFGPQTLSRFFDEGLTRYRYRGRLVTIVPSPQRGYAVFAILPAIGLHEQFRRFAPYVFPTCAVAAFALFWALRRAMRSEYSLAMMTRRAIATGELFMHYQPIVDLHTGRWVGAEALLRWRREGQTVRTDLLVTAAEETGVTRDLTRKVVQLISADLGESLRTLPDFYVTVNVSPAELGDAKLLALLEQLAAGTRCPNDRFVIEATERGMIDLSEGREVTEAIRRRGFRIALDDFGTGYSSLSYLQTLDVDYLKIDKLFIESVSAEAATSNVVGHIINMGHDLDIEIIAEGVEHEWQADFLKRRGVRYAQGWLFAPAMSWPEMMDALETQRALGNSLAAAS